MQDAAQGRQVEDVLQALAVRLEHDRERAVAPRDLQQGLRLQALLPQRRALAWPPPRDEQGTRRVLAEACTEQRRLPHLLHHQILELVGVDQQVAHRGWHVGVREMERDTVVRPEELHLQAERIADPRGQRHRPGGVHPPAERREHADAPVADLVAKPLHDDRPVGREPSGPLLLAQERQKVRGGERVEVVVTSQDLRGLAVGQRGQLPRRLADASPELVRAPDPFALPERHRTRDARRGRDEHAVTRDLLDPPGGGAEHERLPLAGLVHHLLVELADAAASLDLEDAVQAPVGDRARVGDGELAGAGSPADDPADPIPHDPRSQLGELVGRVAAGEHVEHVLELLARQLGERVGTAHEVVQVGHGDLLVRADRDHLLREHVERVARDHGLLDRTLAHRLRDDRALEQVGAELREDAPLRDGTQLVPGPPHALQATGDRLWALDLDHEVDRAHVDAELEARRGDEARDAAGLEQLLDLDPLLACQRAMVRPRDRRGACIGWASRRRPPWRAR